MTHTFRPSVTVAAIIERDDGRFLLIEEETSDGIKLNQPAGHLDPLESLEQAVIREAMEETAHEFIPEGLVGMYMSRYHSKSRGTDVTYLRFTFCGKAGQAVRPAARPWHPAHLVDDARRTRGLPGAPPQPDRAEMRGRLPGRQAHLAGPIYTDYSVFDGGLPLQPDVTKQS
jgi:8-oxo-dGTP pyrophosphatase MutT (NUDIX family)